MKSVGGCVGPQFNLEEKLYEVSKNKKHKPTDKIILILVGAPFSTDRLMHPDAQALIDKWNEKYLTADVVIQAPVVLCPHEKKDTPKLALKCCQDRLRELLLRYKPNVIICLGKSAAIPFGLEGTIKEMYNRVYEVEPISPLDEKTGALVKPNDNFKSKLIVTYKPDEFIDDAKIWSSVEAAFRQANTLSQVDEIKPPDNYYLVETPEEFAGWVERHMHDPRLNKRVHAFDIETNGRSLHPKREFELQHPAKLRCISYSWGPGMAICVPCEDDMENYMPLVKKFMESGVPFIGHNVSFDYFFLRINENVLTKNLVGDTMLMASVINPGKGKFGYGLKPLAAEFTSLGGYETDMKSTEDILEKGDPPVHPYTGKPMKPNIEVTKWERVEMDVMAPYNCADADATLQIYHHFIKILNEWGALKAHWLITHAIVPLGEMEHNGFLINREWVDTSREQLKAFENQYRRELRQLCGIPDDKPDYDWNSPDQMGMVLYDILKYDVPNTSIGTAFISKEERELDDSNRPTDDAALAMIGTPFTQCLRKYRRVSKLLATYFNGYLINTGLDNRLRADFNLTGTITGRLSSSGDANL